MEPQSTIPCIVNPESIADRISRGYDGLANVNLNPKMVDYLLSLNNDNRQVKVWSVNAYANSFRETGYACINLMHISTTGALVDGQHRLLALQRIYSSGETIGEVWQLVKFGTTKVVQMDIDNGTSRTFRDALKLNGYVTDNNISSALRLYAGLVSPTYRVKFTANELKEIYDSDFKQVLELGKFGSVKNLQLIGSHSFRPAPWVIATFRICQKHFGTEKMKAVYEEFYCGENINAPMVRFRNWLINNRGKMHFSVESKNNSRTIMGYMLYAVKKSINGETITKLFSSDIGATINGKSF